MKLKFLPLLLLSVILFAACSDDDDDRVVSPVETAKHFTGSELELTFCGNRAVGKDVLFTPDQEDATKATLTFLGASFDVDAAMNGTRDDAPKGLKTSSVFAGEAEVNLPINMIIEGDKGSFEGQGESKYYNFNYKGTVLQSQLNIELSNVVLKNSALAGTAWKVEPIRYNDLGMAENNPLITTWESDKKLAIELFGTTTEYSMTQIMTLVIGLPIIPAEGEKEVAVVDMIGQILQQVAFENDGNISATYVDMKTKQPATSPYGLAQYVIENDSVMKLVLNPFAIAENAKKDEAEKEENTMAEVMKALTPQILMSVNADDKLSNGINIRYSIEGNKMRAYVDETLFLPVLKVIVPMLQNPDLINTIVEKIKENPEMQAMAPMIESALKQFPEIINTTTKMEIGIIFEKI